jgi:hypothetical protein
MLNVDGGYRHNDKKGAIGGLLRDWNGEPVMVFYQLIHTVVSMENINSCIKRYLILGIKSLICIC